MSFILFIIFIVFAVLFRIAKQWYRTKDFGLRAASRNSSMVEILPGTIFIVSFCVGLGVAALAFLNLIMPFAEIPRLVKWIFFVIGLIGIAVAVISQNQMGNSWRIGVDHTETTSLTTTGLYARSRNPIYFGILIFFIGLCGTLVHPVLLITTATCWGCIELVVRKIEEPYLQNTHGEVFSEYIRKTNRYLPIKKG